jgi:hypothetical protein
MIVNIWMVIVEASSTFMDDGRANIDHKNTKLFFLINVNHQLLW